MTNEERVKLIQDGHEEHIEQLWIQVKRFVAMRARQRISEMPAHN